MMGQFRHFSLRSLRLGAFARVILPLACFALPCAASTAADELVGLEQQAFNAAVQAVAGSVVQIHAIGGLEQVDDKRISQGPSTGLIITPDGYIVSSAFNFAQQPASILVQLPGGEQLPAEIIGRDSGRMLVLLKVASDEPLPAAQPASIANSRVGDWAVAVGRTFQADQVNVSVGVVSGLNRMHGRVLQTDANVSTANYGGPLVDVRGRVLGVLVPMAPAAPGAAETSEVAGAEFYDSGIGFAVPLEHVLAVLPRWIKDRDLKRGLLGIGMTPGNPHATPPTITAVWPGSPGAAAGWQQGDLITAVDGAAVASQTDLRFRIVPRYAGDKLKVTLRRGEGDDAKVLETEVTLAAKLEAFRHAFLGVLPSRPKPGDDDEPEGVTIRAIWPESPAAKAGLKPGDRIARLGKKKVADLGAALAQLNAKNPGDRLAVLAMRGKEEVTVQVELADLPTELLSSSALPSSNAAADAAPDATAPELAELHLPEFPQAAWYCQPSGDGPLSGLLIWLADGRRESAEAQSAQWATIINHNRLTILMPAPGDKSGWTADDLEYLARLVPTAARRLDIDPNRVVVAGEAKAGQLAYAIALAARQWVRGVVAIDSPMPRTLQAPPNSPNERLAVLSIETQGTPLAPVIRQDLTKLHDAGYSATRITRPAPAAADSNLDAVTRAKIARWIDALDRF